MKEELIDDIIEESQPYKRPESVRKRTEPSVYTKYPKMATVAPDNQTTSLAMSQGSVYAERIAKFLKNNPVVNLFSHYKIKYDESDNLVIRGVRTVTENIGDLLRSNFSQTEMVKVSFIQSILSKPFFLTTVQPLESGHAGYWENF